MTNVKKLDKVCIIGAAGCVGSFLAKLLMPHTQQMVLIDPAYSETNGNHYGCDLNQISEDLKQEILGDATLIIFATSKDVLIHTFKNILRFILPSTLIMDTTSTKIDIARFYEYISKKHDRELHVLSIDPLFKPGVNLTVASVAYFTYNEVNEMTELLHLLEISGCHLFKSTPQEHDEALSIVQVSVHLLVLVFGKKILDSNIPFDILLKYATPPFRLLILLLNRIITSLPTVYWEIQRNNFFGKKIRDDLIHELQELSDIIDNKQLRNFTHLFDKMKQTIGELGHQDALSSLFGEIANKLISYFPNITSATPDKN